MSLISGPGFGPLSGGPAKQLVIICHGVGADGADLISLAPFIAPELPDAYFIAPNGPEPFDMFPTGRQWFSLKSLAPAELSAGIRRAQAALDAFIDAELTRLNLPPDAYALAGFSQGAMTALFTGLRRKTAPRAIIAVAGALIDPASLAAELTHRPPVLIAHGEADSVVPASRSRDAAAALNALGVPVQTHFSLGLDHSFDEPILHKATAFLNLAFNQT
jgi:phospholipase/carboxylesterase